MALSKNPRYNLKLKYRRFMEVSFILSLVMVIAAFKFFPHYEIEKVKPEIGDLIVVVDDVIRTEDEAKIPEPPKPVQRLELTDETIDDIDEYIGEDIDDYLPVEHPKKIIEKDDDYEEVPFIKIPEELPTPIGGINAIMELIEYPPIAIKSEVQGKVYVLAYVDENGNVYKTELLRGIGAGCDEEAMQAVAKTKFNPGKQRGRAVKTVVSIPVKFELRNR